MLYSKIKFVIDMNNDELLETIWEHMRKIKSWVLIKIFILYK
jgi:hypothetical protein